jgi:hypothetical protein
VDDVEDSRIVITKADLETNPHAAWSAFIELLNFGSEVLQTKFQWPAQLVFWYESEIQNGGHLQYFLNEGADPAETVSALDMFGATPQARILEEALQRWKSRPRPGRDDPFDYFAMARENEFHDLDKAFGACAVPLMDVLKSHFEEHESEYIIRV